MQEIADRLLRLEHEAELLRTVFVVKEPNTSIAAEAYEGLRRQVAAAAAERRSHLVQLAAMASAVGRATSVDDLRPQVREWMAQADVTELNGVPPGAHVQDLFEDLGGEGLAGADAIEVVEPAYVDAKTGAVVRLGRARRVIAPVEAAKSPLGAGTADETATDDDGVNPDVGTLPHAEDTA
jgi:hypothetical protein